jgi:FkbM family methyltransferase
MAGSKSIAAVWRFLFYLFRPQAPFVMRTEHYLLEAYPLKGTLTRSVLRRGTWEPGETAAFIAMLKPGACVIDAGANFGHYALVAAKFVGARGSVIAFEPDPFTFGLLQKNISLNGMTNIEAVMAGLSDETTRLGLTLDEANPGGHSFVGESVWKAGATVEAQVYRLDDYVAQHDIPRVDVLKADVQGFEWRLLAGARATIARDRPIVFCEVTPEALRQHGDDHEVLLRFFEASGYSVGMVNRKERRSYDIDYATARALLGRENAGHADLIFTDARA